MSDLSKDDKVEKSPNEARQSVKLGVMRYVLAISLALVILAFGIVYFSARP